jgi:hypothetical protein
LLTYSFPISPSALPHRAGYLSSTHSLPSLAAGIRIVLVHSQATKLGKGSQATKKGNKLHRRPGLCHGIPLIIISLSLSLSLHLSLHLITPAIAFTGRPWPGHCPLPDRFVRRSLRALPLFDCFLKRPFPMFEEALALRPGSKSGE